ncbi:MAG TPA: hypothetical protein QGH10_25970 [Armatimonadota bacterium]|nr:hypothetical protein [Armatimonadota bacterium]
MQCPSCQTNLPPGLSECPGCGLQPEWFIRKRSGEIYGPLRHADVERCVREARVAPGDEARLGPDGDFLPAHEVLGHDLVAPPPPVAYPDVVRAVAIQPKPPRQRNRGCVTCMIVCALLAIGGLLAIIPISRNIQKNTSAACAKNLRDIINATSRYATDHDDQLPTMLDWQSALARYVASRDVFICPSERLETGYAPNDILCGVDPSTVRGPSQALLWWDAGAHVTGTSGMHYTWCTSPRHLGKDNFGFLDGHVEAFEPGNIGGNANPQISP